MLHISKNLASSNISRNLRVISSGICRQSPIVFRCIPMYNVPTRRAHALSDPGISAFNKYHAAMSEALTRHHTSSKQALKAYASVLPSEITGDEKAPRRALEDYKVALSSALYDYMAVCSKARDDYVATCCVRDTGTPATPKPIVIKVGEPLTPDAQMALSSAFEEIAREQYPDLPVEEAFRILTTSPSSAFVDYLGEVGRATNIPQSELLAGVSKLPDLYKRLLKAPTTSGAPEGPAADGGVSICGEPKSAGTGGSVGGNRK